MKKTYLLTPGPTAIPEAVLSDFSRPILHHRTPQFQAVFREVEDGLKHLFQTSQDVMILSSSGTGAMEAAVSNLFCKGDEVITLNGGKFGERWTKIAKAYGLKPIEIRVEAGEAVELTALEDKVRSHPNAKAVLFQASETSTGVEMPTEGICKIARKAGMLSVCDGITACGVFPVPMDAWGIDVLMTGSQKALMIPPGLAFIAFSENAWASQSRSDLPRFYFDLAKERKLISKHQTAWTPAISLIQGLQSSLRLMREEGFENIYQRHALLARATRSAVEALGLERFAIRHPSTAVTAVKVPATIADGKQIPKLMRDQYGVTITGGQDELEGKIFRLAHFGYCGEFDITTAIACLELVLNQLKFPVKFGQGVGAALQVFAEKKI